MGLKETLERINWHYGRGKIVKIEFNQGGDVVTRKPLYSQEERRKFTVFGDTVTFLGHKQKLKG